MRAYLIEGGIEMIPKQSLKTEVTERMINGTGSLGRPERAQYAEHRIQGGSWRREGSLLFLRWKRER